MGKLIALSIIVKIGNQRSISYKNKINITELSIQITLLPKLINHIKPIMLIATQIYCLKAA